MRQAAAKLASIAAYKWSIEIVCGSSEDHKKTNIGYTADVVQRFKGTQI